MSKMWILTQKKVFVNADYCRQIAYDATAGAIMAETDEGKIEILRVPPDADMEDVARRMRAQFNASLTTSEVLDAEKLLAGTSKRY